MLVVAAGLYQPADGQGSSEACTGREFEWTVKPGIGRMTDHHLTMRLDL